MKQKKYWGPFEKIYNDSSTGVAEVSSYGRELAHHMDTLFILDQDIKDFAELAKEQNGKVLELGCGSGRIALRLAEQGLEVTGLDLSSDMLNLLEEKLRKMSPEIQSKLVLVEGDATDFDLGEKFESIFFPYFSIALFGSPSMREKLFQSVAKHLSPDGIFAFDFMEFLEKDYSLWNKQVVSLDIPHSDDLMTVKFGMMLDESKKYILENSHWKIPESNGTYRQFLENKTLALLDMEEIEKNMSKSNLEIVKHEALYMESQGAVKHYIQCRISKENHYPLWHPYIPMDKMKDHISIFTKGKGVNLFDEQGKKYIDLSGGLWSVQCGLGNQKIIDAIKTQLETLSYGTLFAGRGNDKAIELAKKIIELVPGPLNHVYLTGSGSESVELSIKLARLYNELLGNHQKKEIVYLDQSYHGTFFGSMGVTGLYVDKHNLDPQLPGLSSITSPHPDQCPPGVSYESFAVDCAKELERHILKTNQSVAAFIFEPILGSAGVVVPPREYFTTLRKICNRYDVLLIVDEVATGFGRTGDWFAFSDFDIVPDMVLLSKGINSGYLPIGATVFSEKIGYTLMKAGSGIGHGSSHNGNPACCASALASIEYIEENNLLNASIEKGEYFKSKLEELLKFSTVKEVRSKGLMLALGLCQSGNAAVTKEQVAVFYGLLQQNGVLTYPGPSSLILMPALTITKEEIDECASIMTAVLLQLNFEHDEVKFVQ